VVTGLPAASSRRSFIAGTGVALGGAATALAGCGHRAGPALRGNRKLTPVVARSDIQVLNAILPLEYRAIAAYTAGIPLLTGHSAKAAKHFLDQELTHAGEMQGLVHEAHGKWPMPPPSYDLGHPVSEREVLVLLYEVERTMLGAYLEAVPRLSPGRVRAAIASLFANDAQHISVVRLALGRPPAPSPLVTAAAE
jgi:hypothetical protein